MNIIFLYTVSYCGLWSHIQNLWYAQYASKFCSTYSELPCNNLYHWAINLTEHFCQFTCAQNTITLFLDLIYSLPWLHFRAHLTKVIHIISFGAYMGSLFEKYCFGWCCYWCWRYSLCLLMVCLSWTDSSPYVLNWVADCWLCNCLFSFLHSCMMQT